VHDREIKSIFNFITLEKSTAKLKERKLLFLFKRAEVIVTLEITFVSYSQEYSLDPSMIDLSMKDYIFLGKILSRSVPM